MIDKINHINIKQVALVGAGPGGIEYITLKALKAISLADVILYDDIIKDILPELVSPKVELIDVGKRLNDGIDQNDRQQIVNELMLKHFNAGKRVVRLKGGDPMVFGKIKEEIDFLKNEGIDFEIIPGISSGQAGAAIFKIPLTVRGKATELLLSTAQKINSEFTDYAGMAELINKGTPIIIYMGGTRIQEIAKAFIEQGISVPVHLHILSKVGTQQQCIFSSTLTQVIDNPPANIELPAILIIGKHAIIN